MFVITRLYNDGSSDSHFEEVSIPLKAAGSIERLSAVITGNLHLVNGNPSLSGCPENNQ